MQLTFQRREAMAPDPVVVAVRAAGPDDDGLAGVGARLASFCGTGELVAWSMSAPFLRELCADPRHLRFFVSALRDLASEDIPAQLFDAPSVASLGAGTGPDFAVLPAYAGLPLLLAF